MNEETSAYKTWEEIITNFLTYKKEAEEEAYLKIVIKSLVKFYTDKGYLDDTNTLYDKEVADLLNSKKEKDQSAIAFQRSKFKNILKLNPVQESVNLENIEQEYDDKCDLLSTKYEAHKWISEAASNASSVSFATHVVKLTHSKINSPSFYDSIDSRKDGLLTTADLIDKKIDGAVSGNQFAPIFQFLELELDGKKLVTEFRNESSDVLKPFTKNKEDLVVWNDGFKKSLIIEKLSTHFLSKQVYFPITQEDILEPTSYHLLCNVKSSSMAHAIFERTRDDEQKILRQLRSKEKFSNDQIFSLPYKARLGVTASNHSNASQLNGRRGGKLYLLSSQPPTWQSQLKPPINKISLFDNLFGSEIKDNVFYLREFLLRFDHLDLSVQNPIRRQSIDKWLANIIDEVLFYIASIQDLPSGWSNTNKIKLKSEHQYLLDPYRDDDVFQAARKTSSWQVMVCEDFAYWLNKKLKGKDKQFTPQNEHTRMWIELLEQPLREHEKTIGIEIQFQKKGQLA